MALKIIRSGMQNGVDIAALKAAKELGFTTAGTMPKGFLTLDGNKPEYATLYNAIEHASSYYPSRTYENVKDSDGTLRIFMYPESKGELLTKKAIVQYNKPCFDVQVQNVNNFNLPESIHPISAASWIISNNIEIINIAGNSEKTCPGIGEFAYRFVKSMLSAIKEKQP